MRAVLAVACLLLAGCAAPAPAAQQGPAPAVQEFTAPAPRLLNCTVEHRFLSHAGFVEGHARLGRAEWHWGVNPVPATRLEVPLLDPLPGGWSALAVGLQVRTRSGTAAVAPVGESPIILGEPGTYVGFPSPMPPGYQGGARAIDFALDAESAKALPGTLVFSSTFVTTGDNGLDLALTSDPGALDSEGHERLTRLDAFYCGGERLSLADFLGYDFDKEGYDR